jgi:hypothetical protein
LILAKIKESRVATAVRIKANGVNAGVIPIASPCQPPSLIRHHPPCHNLNDQVFRFDRVWFECAERLAATSS